MNLPPKWKRLTRRHSAPSDRTPVAVFSTPDDWNLSLTWITSRKKSDDETLIAFDTATMSPGRIDLKEAQTVANHIFPTLGEIVRAAAVELPDGKRALEIIEIICSGDDNVVEKVSYSLILPRRQRGEYRNKVNFQKLSFTASPQTFHDRIQEVARATRSFHYPSMVA